MREIGTAMVFLCLIGMSCFDWRYQKIPMVWLVKFGAFVMVWRLMEGSGYWELTVLGILVGILSLWMSKVTKEAVGYGDSVMILLLGIHLGIIRQLLVLTIASMLSAVLSLVGMTAWGWTRRKTIPFLPFLSIAYGGVMFCEIMC